MNPFAHPEGAKDANKREGEVWSSGGERARQRERLLRLAEPDALEVNSIDVDGQKLIDE